MGCLVCAFTPLIRTGSTCCKALISMACLAANDCAAKSCAFLQLESSRRTASRVCSSFATCWGRSVNLALSPWTRACATLNLDRVILMLSIAFVLRSDCCLSFSSAACTWWNSGLRYSCSGLRFENPTCIFSEYKLQDFKNRQCCNTCSNCCMKSVVIKAAAPGAVVSSTVAAADLHSHAVA